MPLTTMNMTAAMIMIDGDGDEAAIGNDGTLLLRIREVGGGDRLAQRQEVVGEVEAADGAENRHEKVADDRFDDLAEGRADDDADREVDDVALEGKFPEFLEHWVASFCDMPAAAPRGHDPG